MAGFGKDCTFVRMIFITGATGVLGSQLIFDLSKDEVAIRALYRSDERKEKVAAFFRYFLSKEWETRWNRIEWVKGDVLETEDLLEFMKGCDSVYHCAAMVSFHRRDFNTMMHINRQGTANVVNVALEYGLKLCHVSSTAAIGEGTGAVISETTPWKVTPKTTGYSHSKYASEKEVWRGIEEGLDAVMVNPCVVIGAGNWSESSLTLFKTLEKGSLFYPPGSNATVDARDVTEIMIRLMNSDISAERYLCIGSNQPFETLMTEISTQLGKKPPRFEAPKWMVALGRRVLSVLHWIFGKRSEITRETSWALFSHRSYDNTKVREALNVQFRDLPEMVQFAIENRQR